MIKKRGKIWVLLSKTTGRVLGHHQSKASAQKQERAIQISKARAAGHRIPRLPRRVKAGRPRYK
ncbi:hypothetical protein HY388_02475 [Candidatus Daviesbacteria bacterium]|nr:hypothetical protein [Candidatus Daviesbacteria bacterium]